MNQDRVLEILETFGNEIRVIIDEANDEKTAMVLVIARCTAARDKAAQQIQALLPQGDGEGLLTDEEKSTCLLTEDEVMEIEQMCTIGLAPDEHIEYEQRYQWLTTKRVQEKTAKAQQLLDNSRHQEEIREIFKIMDSLMFEIGREAFAEPQHIPQAGRELISICLTANDWHQIEGAYQNFKKRHLGE